MDAVLSADGFLPRPRAVKLRLCGCGKKIKNKKSFFPVRTDAGAVRAGMGIFYFYF
jgi:hypothetical protein